MAELLGSLPAGSRHRVDAGWRLAAPGFADPAENRLFTAEDGTLLGMAAWARERFTQLDAARGYQLPYWIEVGERDGLRHDLAARHGFDMVGDVRYVMLCRDLDAEGGSRRQVPGGITIRPLAGAAAVPAYVAAHRAAFGSRDMTVAWRSATLTMPGYEPELDLVAVAGDGTIAGAWA